MWSSEHFNHYIEGNHVVLQTDHKQFVSILMKPIHTASPKIHRLLLRISSHNVKLEYIKDKTSVIADALSRMTMNNNNSSTPYNDNISIDEVCSNVQISTTGLEKIRQETSKMSHCNILNISLITVGRKPEENVPRTYICFGTTEMNYQ